MDGAAAGDLAAMVRVLELGLEEPGANETAWGSEGWVRVDAPVPERWNLRRVGWTPTGISVDPIAVDANGSASFAVDPVASRTTLVIAPTAPRTLLPANYSLTVSVQ